VIIWAEGRAFSTGLNLKESISLLPPRTASDSDASRNQALFATISDSRIASDVCATHENP